MPQTSPGSPGGKEVGRLSLKVVPDTDQFIPDLDRDIKKIEKAIKLELPVELDFTQAQADLKEFKAFAESGDAIELELELDTAGAMARLDLTLAAMQGTADLNPINVDVEVDGAAGAVAAREATENLNRGLREGASSSAQMGRNFLLWGPLIIAAAVAVAGLAPALAALIPLVAGFAIAGGVIYLGFDQLKKTLGPIGDAFKGIKKEIGGILTEGLDPLVKTFVSKVVPVIKTGLGEFATLLNGVATSMFKFLNSAEGVSLIGQFFTGVANAMKPFAALAAPLTEVFLRLSIAALPALEMMGKAIGGVVDDFNKFLAKGKATDTITKSMQYLGETLSILGSFIGDIFPALFAATPALLAALKGITTTIGGAFKLLKPFFEFLSRHTTTVGAIASALTVLVIGFGAVAAVMVVVNAVMAANPFVLAAIAIVAVGAALVYAYKHSETFRTKVDAILEALKPFKTVLIGLGIAVGVFILAALGPFTLLGAAVLAIGALLVAAYFKFETFRNIVNAVFAGIMVVVRAAIAFIVPYLMNAFNIILGFVSFFRALFTGDFAGAWAAVKQIFFAGVAQVKLIFSSLLSVIGSILGGLGGLLGRLATSAWNKFKSATSAGISTVAGFVADVPGRLLALVKSLPGDFLKAGKAIIGGLIDGIKAMAQKAVDAVKSVLSKARNLLPNSPAKEGPFSGKGWTLYSGRAIIQGVIDGVKDMANPLKRELGRTLDTGVDFAGMIFDPKSVGSLNQSMSASIGAIIDETAGPSAQEIFLNWDTGRGTMQDISDQSLAQKEFLAAQDKRMGVPA